LGEAGEAMALKLAQSLRRAGFHIDLGYSGNIKRRLQRADKIKARAALILGDNELERQVAALRDLDTGEQTEIPLAALEDRLAPFR
jgi:histidyl-tRNA synthetase